MKIISILFSILVGFSFENIGEEKFSANQIVKVNFEKDVVKLDSALVLEENVKDGFDAKNLGFVFSKAENQSEIKFGFGNLLKTDLCFQSFTPSLSFWSNNLLGSSLKANNFLSLPSISDGEMPFGFGISANNEKVAFGFSLFSQFEGFPKLQEASLNSLFQGKNHFCFFDLGKKWDFDNIGLSFLLDSVLGYGVFSESQKKSSWFCDNQFVPKSILPVFVERICFQYRLKENSLKSGFEFRFCKSPKGQIKYCFWNENNLKFSWFNLVFGVLVSEFDFPLLNEKYLEKDFELKINPNIILKKHNFGVSFIATRKNEDFKFQNFTFEKNPYFWEMCLALNYDFQGKNVGIDLDFQIDDFIEGEILAESLKNQNTEYEFCDFLNQDAVINMNLDFRLYNFSLEIDGKINMFSTVNFWENPENQYFGKLAFSYEKSKVKIDSSLKANIEKNCFASEELFFEGKWDNCKIAIKLKVENDLFYEKFFEKSEEKSGINFGISGTINL